MWRPNNRQIEWFSKGTAQHCCWSLFDDMNDVGSKPTNTRIDARLEQRSQWDSYRREILLHLLVLSHLSAARQILSLREVCEVNHLCWLNENWTYIREEKWTGTIDFIRKFSRGQGGKRDVFFEQIIALHPCPSILEERDRDVSVNQSFDESVFTLQPVITWIWCRRLARRRMISLKRRVMPLVNDGKLSAKRRIRNGSSSWVVKPLVCARGR